MRKLLWVLLCLTLITSPESFSKVYGKALNEDIGDCPLHINEIMASNTSTLMDGDLLDKDSGKEGGAYSDWVEIYNKSGRIIDLTGYKLSDAKSTWIFPQGKVPANGYLLIWTSGKNKVSMDGQLHTNFKLDASGEVITLIDPKGEICHRIEYETLSKDESYGAKSDGAYEFVTFSKASPGITNSQGSMLLKPPVFSKKGGLYKEGFDLSLYTISYDDKTKDTGSETLSIYYTIDGSDPIPGATGTIKYTNSIPLKSKDGETEKLSCIATGNGWKLPQGEVFKGWTIKAITANDNGISKVVTNSYFIDSNIYNRYNLPIISVVTEKSNFFDSEKGIYLTRNSQGTEALNSEIVPVHIEAYGVDGSLWFSQNADAKLHGQSSVRFPQKTLRIYAKEDYENDSAFKYKIFEGLKDVEGNEIKSFKRLLLRNSGNDWSSTMFRDGLMQSMVSHLNIDTQAYRPAVMFLNGEFWGIHNIRERFDKYYFASHYNLDKDNLAILSWKLATTETIEVDEGTKEDRDAYLRDITEYLKDNSVEDKMVYENIKTKIDVENFIDYQLSQIYFANTDWPGNNVVVWKYKRDDGKYDSHAPLGQDGRWRWVLKDTDFGFGFLWDATHNTLEYATNSQFIKSTVDSSNISEESYLTEAKNGVVGLPEDMQKGAKRGRNFDWAVFLLKTLLQNPDFRNEFINRFADNINTSFEPDRVCEKIDEMKASIEVAIPEHIKRWQGISDWNSNVEKMKAFAKDRPDNMRKFIVNKFGSSGVIGTSRIMLSSEGSKGYIKINTLDIKSSTPGVVNPQSWTGTYFKGVPVTLMAIPEPGYKFDHWEVKGIPLNDVTSDTIAFDPVEDIDIMAIFQPSIKDIQGHWAESSIKYLLKEGILKGYNDSTFRPEDYIDRSSAAVILAKVLGLETGECKKEFADQIPQWAKGYIMALRQAGIIDGFEDNTFKGHKKMTREEMVVMIMKALEYPNVEFKNTLFKDNDKIGKWARAYVEKASQLKLIKGYEDESFRPDNMAKRGEFVEIIGKTMKLKSTGH